MTKAREAWISNRVTGRRRCFVLAVAVAVLCLAASTRGGEWKYVVPPPGDRFEHPPLRALQLSDIRPADLVEKVAYRGTRRQYGQIHLGSPASPRVAVVLDYITTTDFDLYLDADRNRVIEPGERVGGQGGTWRTTLDVLALDGVKKKRIARTVIFQRGRRGPTLRFAVCGYVEGRVTIAGRKCTVRRVDGDGNGLLADPQDWLWIDLNNDGHWDAVEEQFFYAPILELDGRRYAVHADEFGERLSLDELQGAGSVKLTLAPELARRSAGVTTTLVGRDGLVVSLRQSAGSAAVPVGEYRLSAVAIEVDDPAGGPAVHYVFGDAECRQAIWHRVEPDRLLALDPIGTLGLDVSFGDAQTYLHPGEEFRVQPGFHTGDGLVITTADRVESAAKSDWRGVHCRVMLTKPDGGVLSSIPTGFG